VADVMTRSVVSAYRGASFKNIAQVVIERGVTAMPVIDKEHRVIGVVSESDLLIKEERKRWRRRSRAKAHARTAEELMTSPAITVSPETSVVRAARLLDRHRVKRLPVVDSAGRLVGIVSRRDLLRVFTRSDDDIRDEINEEIFECLLRTNPGRVTVQVNDGIATLNGRLERGLVPVARRLAATVDGVVDVVDRLNNDQDASRNVDDHSASGRQGA
jgi:CBS-domain-containing membrane protein